MKTIKLYGEMGRRFGRVHQFIVDTPAEAFSALCSQVNGFRAYLHANAGNRVAVYSGRSRVTKADLGVSYEDDVIRIVPVIEGAGGNRPNTFWTIVIAVVLIYTGQVWAASLGTAGAGSAAAWAASTMTAIGTGLLISGIAQLLADDPKNPDAAEVQTNYGFNGAKNTSQQGNPIPLAYGKIMVGSQVISIGLDVA